MERTLYRDGKMICIKAMAMLSFLRPDGHHFDFDFDFDFDYKNKQNGREKNNNQKKAQTKVKVPF